MAVIVLCLIIWGVVDWSVFIAFPGHTRLLLELAGF